MGSLQVNELLMKKLYLPQTHRKNGFAEESKNLTRYKSENNFVGPLK